MTIFKTDVITPVDIDFTKEGSQTFSADQTYTMGGLPWLKQNSAQEQTSATVGASGLVFNPNQTGDWNTGTGSRLLPFMALRLRDAFNFNLTMGLRIWVYNPNNAADANYEDAVWTLGTGNSNYEYLIKRGRGLSGNAVSSHVSHTTLRNNSYLDFVATLDATNDVVVLEVPKLSVPVFTTYVGGLVNGRWPLLSAMRPVNANGTFTTNPQQFQNEQIYACLGAQRAGSGDTAFTATYGKFRIDVIR